MDVRWVSARNKTTGHKQTTLTSVLLLLYLTFRYFIIIKVFTLQSCTYKSCKLSDALLILDVDGETG